MPNHPVYLRLPSENEQSFFRNRSCAEAVIGVVVAAQKDDWFCLHGFVVLPEALEMVLTPIKQSVGSLVAHIQAETIPPLAILLPNATTIWERRYAQLVLTSQRALDARLAMLLLAPVAAGIVDMASAYPYSSANTRYSSMVTPYTGFKKSTNELPRLDSNPVAVGATGTATPTRPTEKPPGESSVA